jgi:hypothetical protein
VYHSYMAEREILIEREGVTLDRTKLGKKKGKSYYYTFLIRNKKLSGMFDSIPEDQIPEKIRDDVELIFNFFINRQKENLRNKIKRWNDEVENKRKEITAWEDLEN